MYVTSSEMSMKKQKQIANRKVQTELSFDQNTVCTSEALNTNWILAKITLEECFKVRQTLRSHISAKSMYMSSYITTKWIKSPRSNVHTF